MPGGFCIYGHDICTTEKWSARFEVGGMEKWNDGVMECGEHGGNAFVSFGLG